MVVEYNSDNPELVNSVVCFIDVLGFTSIGLEAIRSGNGNDFLKEIHSSLSNARNAITPYSFVPAKVKVFTDNVVIGWPIQSDGENELGNTFNNLAEYQFSLAQDGFFIRGGVSIGPHFMDEETVFGPELIMAHDLESKVAVYPRIILSQECIEKVKYYNRYYSPITLSPFHRELLEDIDGEWFSNYLHILFDMYDEEVQFNNFSSLYPHLERHGQKIEEAINKYRNNSKLLKKYSWLANYHNYFCDEFVIGADHLKIETPIKMSPPRRIIT
ncbi:hypothetical protein [Bacillus cereus group sp. BfR-BA-01524]|uniref:hypothetical protein n=1 Tax=Bacillus cereus group sp. BfR-BA-01524 TaxID=2920372 RepID=UPI001F58E19A